MKKWIDRLDKPILALAAISVGLYLADLQDIWSRAELGGAYRVLDLAIDCIFLFDLILKIAALRGPYLKSPWFFIDAVSTLPILSAIASMPEFVESLRFVRGFRMFRILRSSRILSAIQTFRLMELLKTIPGELKESRTAARMLYVAAVAYTAIFLGIMAHVQSREIEFYIVLGNIIGMGLVLFVVHFQMADITSRQVRMLLNIVLPHQVAEFYMKHPNAYGAAVRMPATIVFSDIHGFTQTVEKLGGDLDQLKKHLERVMDAVVEVHRSYDLIVDKFIGDAILSFRGGNLVPGTPEEHAYRVVRASIDSMKAVRDLNDPYFPRMKVGGASNPDCLIGAFGTSKRLSYTVLGDGVNLAARLEPASGKCGTQNFFSELTWQLTRTRPDIVWRHFGTLQVEGKVRLVKVYEAFAASDVPNRRWLDCFASALQSYEVKNFAAAKALFEETTRVRPGGDEASLFYAGLCGEWIQTGAPADWTPAVRMKK